MSYTNLLHGSVDLPWIPITPSLQSGVFARCGTRWCCTMLSSKLIQPWFILFKAPNWPYSNRYFCMVSWWWHGQLSRNWSDELNTFKKNFYSTSEIHIIYHTLLQLTLFSRGFPVTSWLCWPHHLRISIMCQPAHVRFPKTLTFCAVLCRLFNPIPRGSETVHISKARNWIFHCLELCRLSDT